MECQPARLKKDEQAIQDLLSTLDDFKSDNFDDSFPTLISLQTGIVAPTEILEDLNTAVDDGKEKVNHLLEENIFNKEKSLNATLNKKYKEECVFNRYLAKFLLNICSTAIWQNFI